MSLNPFGSIENYPQMLNKIAGYTFAVSLACLLLLNWQIPALGALTSKLKSTLPIEGLAIPVAVIVPAFLVALVSRIMKLHDLVSDVLGIRAHFDVEAILMPLALGAGVRLGADEIPKLRAERNQLMGDAFYEFASGSRPKIDRHYVTMALDQWSWYWVIVEAAVVLGITAVLLLIFGRALPAAVSELLLLGMLFVLARIRVGCVRYALNEVREILSDPARSLGVAGVFSAL